MTDFLNSAFEAVGKAAKPLAPAIDFFAPQNTGPGGQEFSIGNMMNSIGKGLGNAVNEGLVGLGATAYNAVTMKGLSGRDRLLLGGMAALGAGMSARAVHSGWKANRAEIPQMRALAGGPPGGYTELTEGLGDPHRFIDHSVDAQDLMYDRPGINRRQAQILSADDGHGVARGFAQFDVNDPVKMAAAGGLFETYALRAPEGARGAQVDWARFSFAMDSGKVRGTPGNQSVKKLWKMATTAPEELTQEQAEELFGYIQLLGDRTDGMVADDLTVGLAGKLEAIDYLDGDVSFEVSHPVGWNDGRSVDPYIRAKRMQALNPRALSDRGRRMLRMLFDIGDTQYDLFKETGHTDLPKGMHLGRDWYPVALDDTAKAFGIDAAADPAALDRAVAAVSFLSEAEDWETNIVKAKSILDLVGDISDEDFQSWLRNNVAPDAYDSKIPRHKYAGTQAKQHATRFAAIWKQVKDDGFKVDETTMKKVLRLYGGVEPVMDVFRSTKARKQKNFYLNIRYPDGEWPVTIDRHAYDAFLGMDAGIQDRPIDAALGAGDQMYDVVADTYRAVAADLTRETGQQVLPHQVQAVIWEVWRILKGAHPRNGWQASLDGVDMPSPFMLTLNDEVTNPVFDALMGRSGLTGALGQDLSGPVPVSVLSATNVEGLAAKSVGDGYVVLADVDDKVAATVRTKTPGVVGADRVNRWVDSRPLPLMDIEDHLAPLQNQPHRVERTLNSDHAGGVHPALRPETTIVAYVPPNKKQMKTPVGTKARRAGRASVSGTEFSYERLGPDDIDPSKWTDKDSPLQTHAWTAMSSELNPEQIAANGITDYDQKAYLNRLRGELQARGYKPIEMEGIYGGDTEQSFLVFGMTPQEAREIGQMFHQESVLTNEGLLYSDGSNTRRFNTGMEIDPPEVKGEVFDRSELIIGKKRLRFRQDFDWDAEPDAVVDTDLVGNQATNRERVEISVAEGRDLHQLATDLEARGFEDLSIYTNQDQLPGFDRAYETVYTDGAQTMTVRTADGAISNPNGSHVFTRSSSGLPKRPKKGTPPGWKVTGEGVAVAGNTLRIDGRHASGNVEFTGPFQAKLNGQSPIAWGYAQGSLTPIFDELELNSGRFEATVKGHLVTPGDESDLTAAIVAHQHLKAAGYPDALLKNDKGNVKKMELSTSEGRFAFGEEKVTTASRELVTTRNGLAAVRVHNDRKVPRFERLYGVQLDIGWRSGRQQHWLENELVDQLESGMGLVMNDHEKVIHRARLRGISTENMPAQWRRSGEVAYAWFPFAPDQNVILTREFWENPKAFTAQLTEDRANGWLSRRVEPTPRSILVHELGHVLHLSARMGEGMVKDSPMEKEIFKMLGGAKAWRDVAEKEISTTAGVEVSELIAESVSEVLLSDRPSKLARDVYDILTGGLSEYMRFHDFPGGKL